MTARKIDPVQLRAIALTGASIHAMAAHFVTRPDTVGKWLRRDGLYQAWRKLRWKSSQCEHCGCPSPYSRFCSHQCWGLHSRRAVEPALLAPYIENGTPLTQIAAALDLDRGFLRVAMKRQGLYRPWCERRYKKCASLTAGNSSASTASGTVTSRSVESVVQMATCTSCGV